MAHLRRFGLMTTLALVIALGTGAEPVAQALPNPYRAVDGWAGCLPAGQWAPWAT